MSGNQCKGIIVINIITNQSEEGWKWVGLVLILKPDNLSLLVMWLIFIFLWVALELQEDAATSTLAANQILFSSFVTQE